MDEMLRGAPGSYPPRNPFRCRLMGMRSSRPLRLPYFALEASMIIQHRYAAYSDKFGPLVNYHLLGITLLPN